MDKYFRYEDVKKCICSFCIGDDECDHNDSVCKKILDELPTADVALIVHAHWIEQSPDFDLCGVAYYKCSECGREQQLNSHYCQFCGAKMDKEAET